jgi:hypothetical protein
LRPEDELLLRCAWTSTDSERGARIRALLREELSWEYLLQKASGHKMLPLLYWHLDTAAPETVPQDILCQLRDHFRNNTRRNLFLTGELLRLLNFFETHRIPAIPFKGPTLAAFVYGNLALRHSGDLDILVHERDILRAKELLVSQGYREDPLPREQEAAFLRSQQGYHFGLYSGKSTVELHWRIMPGVFSFSPDPEYLWKRLEQVPLGRGTVPTFTPEDLLLILCAHGSKHLWERLVWICDVAALIRVHKGIDWEQVLHQADTLGSRRRLFLGLYLASDLLGAALPEELLQRVWDDSAVKTLAAQVRKRLFQETDGPPELFEEAQWRPFGFKVLERLRDKAWYCVSAAIMPGIGEWRLLQLPYLLSPLYYVLRPMRLTVKYGRRMIKRFL